MSDLKELLERTVEDIYSAGDMTDEEYEDAVETINTPYQVQEIEKYLPDDVRDRWQKAVDNFHDGDISEDEYIDILNEVVDDIEHFRDKEIKDSYDRAMRGVG